MDNRALSGPTERTHFLDLPNDLLILIISEVSPKDTLALRKTCKVIAALSKQRIIWIHHLHKMCEEDTLYTLAFPIASMTTEAIEYAALGPARWDAVMDSQTHESDGALLKPLRTWTLRQPRPRHQLQWSSDHVFLVPGGRFLIVFVSPNLTLWDLKSDSSEPIASHLCRAHGITVHLSPGGRSLKVVAKTYDFVFGNAYKRYIYNVYEIKPEANLPAFEQLTEYTISTNNSLDFTSVCGDLHVFIHGNIILAGYLSTDKWAAWNVADRSIQIIMSDDTILLVRNDSISVWDIASQNFSNGRAILSPVHAPKRPDLAISTLPYPVKFDATFELLCSGLSDWYTGSPQPLMMDLCGSIEDDLDNFHFYRFEFKTSKKSSSFHKTSAFSIDPEFAREISLAPYRVNNSNYVTLWSASGGLFCHYRVQNKGGERERVSKLAEVEDLHPSLFSFCPTSGRLCYVDEEDTEDFVIQVLDFSPNILID